MARPTPEALEQQIHQTLRTLPPRRAPASLEGRVLAAIAQREARPWWQKQFAHWPVGVRLGFLVLATAVAVGAVGLSIPAASGVGLEALSSRVQPLIDTLASLRVALTAVGEVAGALLPDLSTPWLYAIGAAFVALYLTLFGLGATAYRLLWVSREAPAMPA